MNDQSLVQNPVDEAREPATAPAPRKPHWLRRIVILALLGGGAYGAYAGISNKAAPAAPSASAAPILAVKAAQAKIQNVPIYVTGLGTVQPFNSVTVKPRVSGQISDIVFTEGQLVEAGDVLAHIDPRPFLSPLHQAQANLAKDQAQLTNVSSDLQRITSLAQKGYATGQSLDTQKSQLAGLQATILADQAAIENAKTQLDYATITSPISGVVGIRMIDAGNVITPSDPGLVVVNQLEPISVVFTVPSEAIGRWAVGRPATAVPVTARSPDNARTLGTGDLSVVDNRIDPATATIKLKATFPNTDHMLKPGQFVNASMQSVLLSNVLTVPSSAVQQSTSGSYVYLVQPDMNLAQRPVTVARVAGDTTVIASGLSAGDTVVTDGQYSLKPGLKVSLRPDDAALQKVADRTSATE
ncbi:membrane fusion protein, multidrug efflux system [Rhizobiales bacterium GAS191]|jgi:multidrug efflux system membrane fusion protein|nr:membrane fusion protein, multidrug efflux system [Rhizobiales bacterium GAS113]SEC54090.1 membrane fusion protein, multidrug efflux system [Rhizobiales bacterium GAS191]SEC73161.1 membrane fusion protein, multidrug efflux system [Rhizobiales bacterium GAS188]